MNKGAKNLIPIIAVLLILGAGIGFYAAIQSAKQLVSVVVAKGNIPAYTLVTGSNVSEVGVPKGSVTSHDITWAAYQQTYVKANKPLITTLQVLAGDRLDNRAVAKNSQSSFDVVSPDERVVAVTASIVGAGLGTINAGDVVDAQVSSAGGGIGGGGTTFAKVICISASPAGCAGVLPPGVTLSVKSAGASATTTSTLVYVLLAVAANDAAAIAGQQVNLDLNPFCVVGSTDPTLTPDRFVSARPNSRDKCYAPSSRDAETGGSLTATATSG